MGVPITSRAGLERMRVARPQTAPLFAKDDGIHGIARVEFERYGTEKRHGIPRQHCPQFRRILRCGVIHARHAVGLHERVAVDVDDLAVSHLSTRLNGEPASAIDLFMRGTARILIDGKERGETEAGGAL